VVASRVPLAIRQAQHNQGGRAWTERRRDPGLRPPMVAGTPGNT